MKVPKNTEFYGGNGTIHGSTCVNVETINGKVVSVWFRCCHLPFDQTEVDAGRAADMTRMYEGGAPTLVGVQIQREKP